MNKVLNVAHDDRFAEFNGLTVAEVQERADNGSGNAALLVQHPELFDGEEKEVEASEDALAYTGTSEEKVEGVESGVDPISDSVEAPVEASEDALA